MPLKKIMTQMASHIRESRRHVRRGSAWQLGHDRYRADRLQQRSPPSVREQSSPHRQPARVDLALAHQGEVGGTYASVKTAIPSIVHIKNRKSDPIPREWYPDQQGAPIGDAAYANATSYFDVLGWSEFAGAGFTVRYLPAAVTAPSEDLQEIDLRIGGLRPDDAFERFVLPVLAGESR